jgi:urease accessory protein
MLRLTRPADQDAAPPPAARRLRLTYGERSRSRLAAMTADGTAVAILLPRGTVLRDGALLSGDGGEIVCIEAAPQPLARIAAASPRQLLRIVYHLANRHVPLQIDETAVLIERDPVLERMAAGLGAQVEHVTQPFEPEGGAYHGGHGPHPHAHGHDGDQDEGSATIGEQLSIAAHRDRSRG